MFLTDWSSREKKLAILLGLAVTIGLFSWIWNREGEADITTPLPAYVPVAKEKKENEESDDTTLVIDIKGAVLKPGIYQLEAGSRVHHAIDQAGGVQKEADLNQINLAQLLTDEMVVYVPKKGESANSIVQSSAHGKININTASVEELDKLDGIGKAKAEAIVRYREEHGKFRSLEDLKKVSGIGDSTVERFREQVVVP